ncbi:MAG: acyltransferase, partial [Myxococcota bacterium]|nr:acyltransferase [Myxococcota bacterium]
MKYRPEIDGLRALAVVPVIFYHAGIESFSGGYVGVDVFFVISGYLITSIIMKSLERDAFSIVDFYERRARRILPALFLVITACIPFSWALMLPKDFIAFYESILATMLFSSNIYFARTIDYFTSNAEQIPLLHTWSLAVEEQYYVVFPLALMALWKFKKNALIPFLVFTFFASLGLCIWLMPIYPEYSFYLLPTRGWEILLGALCALYLKHAPERDNSSNILSILGLGA